MKLLNFIFLHRNWDRDRLKFARRVKKLELYKLPYSLIFFPEGTTISRSAQEKSLAFSKKINLQPTKNVLLPRVTGLHAAIRALEESLDGILDITIGYSGMSGKVIPEEFYGLKNTFFRGFGPKDIYIYVNYHQNSTVPSENVEEFSRWLLDRFYEKERLLDEFYRKGKFPGNASKPVPLATRKNWIHTLMASLMSLFTCYLLYRIL